MHDIISLVKCKDASDILFFQSAKEGNQVVNALLSTSSFWDASNSDASITQRSRGVGNADVSDPDDTTVWVCEELNEDICDQLYPSDCHAQTARKHAFINQEE